MILNYIISAFKHLWKNRFFTIVNLIGLSIALFIAYNALVYILFQFSFNKHHEKIDSIYLVESYLTDFQMSRSRVAYKVAQTLCDEFPEIEIATKYSYLQSIKVEHNNEIFNAKEFFAVDENILDVFSIPLLTQNANEDLLSDKSSILISEEMAKKYFGDKNPVGELLKVNTKNGQLVFIVKAVFKDTPLNSTFRPSYMVNQENAFDFFELYSDEKDKQDIMDNWGRRDWYTYILLSPNADIDNLSSKLEGFLSRVAGKELKIELKIHSYKELYIDYYIDYEVLYVLLILALLVIFVASANYIILNSALSINRNKEIGIRKVMGAKPIDIKKQFLGESIILSLLALPISIVLFKIFLPDITSLLKIPLDFVNLYFYNYFPYFFLLSIAIGLLSGIYVSYKLSNILVVDVLKVKYKKLSSKSIFRKSLIIFQLGIVISLLIVLFAIRLQLNYSQEKDMGFDKDDIIILNLPRGSGNTQAFLDRILTNPNVRKAALAMEGPPTNSSMNFMVPRFDYPEEEILLEAMGVDNGFLEVFEFELIEGRYFSKQFTSDKNAILLNQTAVESLGLTNPIGKEVIGRKVIGVIKDFHFHSMHRAIPALVIKLATKKYLSEIAIKHEPNSQSDIIDYAKKQWEQTGKVGNLSVRTFDETLSLLYEQEKLYSHVIAIITLIICLIALSGLFGLSLFMIRTKQREVGLKKLYGASIQSIQYSLYREFSYQVLWAFLIAIIPSYFVVSKYLEQYAYQTPLNIWIFILPGIITYLVVSMAVIFYVNKAARTNIIETLKEE